jgi:hypothetical protein
MGVFPHKVREGEIPKRLLLIQDIDNVKKIAELIES